MGMEKIEFLMGEISKEKGRRVEFERMMLNAKEKEAIAAEESKNLKEGLAKQKGRHAILEQELQYAQKHVHDLMKSRKEKDADFKAPMGSGHFYVGDDEEDDDYDDEYDYYPVQ